MKIFLLTIGLIWCLTWQVNAQPCRQINIEDTTQRKLLIKYIEESVRKRCFINDKGVVVITRFTNESGRPSWAITTTIEDVYKDNPPVEWAKLDSDIILFYDGKDSQFDVIKRNPTPDLIRCLGEAIGDRVYIRPAKKDRWFEVDGPKGKVRRIYASRITGGDASNSIIIVFEADGTITMSRSV